jgi:arabinogalactan endo-1,4-beta-galactosidase
MIPKAWRDYGIDEMVGAVYDFTREILVTAVREGVAPEYIQVGNEITNGILWPIGRLIEGEGERGNYESLTRLLDAGCRACREIVPTAKIILHLERSNDKAVYREFFSNMEDAGIDYDIIAASYYPYWHGTPDELFDNLKECRRFGKDIMVGELGYGFTTQAYSLDGESKRLVIDSERAYVPGFTEKYPLSPDGQARFIEDFLHRARANGISGIFYWEPLWLPGEGICWASPEGQKYIAEEGKSTANEWANQCLFDYEGQKLPAFDKYKV